jgi:hypothetical protein
MEHGALYCAPMAQRKKVKLKRLSAMAPAVDVEQLEALADTNGRSVASELRMAVVAHLKKNGRRIDA